MDALPKSLGEKDWQQLKRALPGLKERAKSLVELVDGAAYLFAERPLALDAKAAKLLDAEGLRRHLLMSSLRLKGLADWTEETLEAGLKAVAEARALKFGKVAQPLRAALTGRTTSPGIYAVLEVLGRDESLARLRDQLPANS